MPIFLLIALFLATLSACSDNSGHFSEDPKLAFQNYTLEPQPRGGKCGDRIVTEAPLIFNGFGFNHSNTRNRVSLINSDNVGELVVNFLHTQEGADEKRGAPAVTAQTIFLTSGRNMLAINRRFGCEYWSFTTPGTGSVFRSGSVLYVAAEDGRPATVYAADFNGQVYAINAQNGELLWQKFAGTTGAWRSIRNGFMWRPRTSTSTRPVAAQLIPSVWW